MKDGGSLYAENFPTFKMHKFMKLFWLQTITIDYYNVTFLTQFPQFIKISL